MLLDKGGRVLYRIAQPWHQDIQAGIKHVLELDTFSFLVLLTHSILPRLSIYNKMGFNAPDQAALEQARDQAIGTFPLVCIVHHWIR
jgi:hypothetical protein